MQTETPILPAEYLKLDLNQRQHYVQQLHGEVSKLQAILDEIRSKDTENLLSKKCQNIVQYPPSVRFRPKRNVKAQLKNKIMGMTGFKQSSGHDGLSTITQNGTVVLWDAESGMKYEAFHAGKGSTMSHSVNSNGSLLVAGGLTCYVEVYNIGKQLRELTNENTAVDRAVRRFENGRNNMATRAPQYCYSLSGHDALVSSIDFFDRTTVVSGAHDDSIIVWDALEAKSTIKLHETSPVTCLHTSGAFVFTSGTQSGAMKVWDVRDREGHAQRMNCDGSIVAAKFIPEGQSVLAATAHGMHLFDLRCNAVLEEYKFSAGSITTMDVSASGRLAIIGTEDGCLYPVDLFQNKFFREFGRRKQQISSVVIQGDAINASSWDGSIRSYTYMQ